MSNGSPLFDGMSDLFLFGLIWVELLNEDWVWIQVFIYVERR